jgi:hypothetical protein
LVPGKGHKLEQPNKHDGILGSKLADGTPSRGKLYFATQSGGGSILGNAEDNFILLVGPPYSIFCTCIKDLQGITLFCLNNKLGQSVYWPNRNKEEI